MALYKWVPAGDDVQRQGTLPDGFSNRLRVIEVVFQLQTYLFIISPLDTPRDELVTNFIFEKSM